MSGPLAEPSAGSGSRGPGHFDWRAIRSGASVALVFAVPLSIAAWHQRRGTPLSHGIVTAGGTYLAAQSVFVAVKLLRGDDVGWAGVLFNLSVTLMAGILGGFLGSFLQRQGVSPRSITTDPERGRP